MIDTLLIALALGAAVQTDAASTPPTPEQAAAGPWDPAARIAAQREALAALAFLDGEWRGEAAYEGHAATHTERVGTLLDGSVRLIEGRAYGPDGKTSFNAFAVISFDPVKRSYTMRSYAEGYAGDYPLTLRPDGFTWSHPAGPGVSMRYTATVKDGEWRETGERTVGSAAPVRIFEMKLKRLGPASWPAGGAVQPR
jgi:hypothetical protein